MKKMTAVVAFVVYIAIFSGCASIRLDTDTLHSSTSTVVIIGGVNATSSQMQVLQEAFPGSIAIVPDICYPLWLGADNVTNKIISKGINGRLILIGHSWGGLLARTIDANNPDLVVAVVTIATPNGHFRFAPDYIADFFLTPPDRDSKTPLFIIAGVKDGAAKRWWMQTNDSDGVIDVKSATTMGERKIRASAIFGDEHNELLADPGVVSQVKAWLQPMDLYADRKLLSTGPVN